MSGTKLIDYKYCDCCGKKFLITEPNSWEWKMKEKGKVREFYCSYKCYSKVFDSKYKASRVSSRVSVPSAMPVELERALRSGRR